MDDTQSHAATTAGQGTDSQVNVYIDPHVTIAIACLVIALLVAFFVLVVSTIDKKNDVPKA